MRPLPWGPVEMEIGLVIGSARNPVAAWKPLIDALVPLLGRRPDKTEFDIEDGRITSLAIHRTVDPSLGHALRARLWWRMAPAPPSEPPPLSYEVGAPAPAAAPHVTPRVGTTSDSSLIPITTLESFQTVNASARGYVVVTDTANPPKMHRAGCRALRDENFIRKVVINQMRNGKYLHVRTESEARLRWPRLEVHDCG